MLQSIRDNIRGWIAWVVVILLSIPFALFGINTYFEGRFTDNVALVDGDEITRGEFRDRYQRQYMQIRQMFGQQFDPDMIDEDRLRRQVLDRMVRERLLEKRAREHGYYVSDGDVASAIQEIPAFQSNGRFSVDMYRAALRREGYSPSQFEALMKADLLMEQIERGIAQSAFVTESELRRLVALENQERRVSWLSISASRYFDEVEVSEDEIAEHYDEYQDRFMTPESVDIQYVELRMADIKERIEVSEDELRQAWERERDRYLEDEERLARHILVEIVGGDVEAARERVTELRRRIVEDGESFEVLATEYSADPLSAEEGGSLDWVTTGAMVD
jgi:peptidyl-prolyl cis-trans isomerase D